MKRVLPYVLFFFCIGIVLAGKTQNIPLIVLGITAASFLCAFVTKRTFCALYPFAVLLGMLAALAQGHDKSFEYMLDNAAANREKVTAECTVISSSPREDGHAYVLKTSRIKTADGTEISEPFGIRLFSPDTYLCGDVMSINARLYAHNPKFNPSDFDSKLYLKIRGCDYSFYIDEPKDAVITVTGRKTGSFFIFTNFMYYIRDRVNAVFDGNFAADKAAVLKAVVTGDKSGLDGDIPDDFRKAGIYHFLAVSGLHLSVLSAFMLFLLCRLDKRAAYPITMLFLALYWVMTGGSVSVTRAVLMIYILMIGRLTDKSYDLISSISLAALVLLAKNPLFLYDTGFLYSFGAVYGIALAANAAAKVKKHRKLVLVFAASFGASLFSRIITLLNFYTVNPFEILTNIILMPLLSFIVIYAFVTGFSGLIFSDIRLIAKPLELLVGLLMRITRLLGGISAVKVGHPNTAVLCTLLIATLLTVFFLLRPCRRRFICILVCLPLIFAVGTLTRERDVNISFLYVGQGDSCVITKDKTAYIIDCGGTAVSDIGKDTGRYRIMPYLDYCGVKKVGAVFISHNDTDHIKGLFDMFGAVDIDGIYIAELSDRNENYDLLMKYSKEHSTPVKTLECGDKTVFGDISFEVLYPFEHNEKDSNENSLVLRFEHGSNSVLFTGDISKKSEKRLLESNIDADVLKLAHHGSKGSSCNEFIEAVSPRLAIASAGNNNQFRHPSRETVERLNKHKVPVYATFDGMIKLKSNGNKFDIYIAEEK